LTACDSATGSAIVAVVVNPGKVPDRPAPDQDTVQCTVAVTVNACPGCPAEDRR
jgi:hypothetical protein